MSQLEAFATFRTPALQVYNLNALSTTPVSILFSNDPGIRAATGLGTTTITCANSTGLNVGMTVESVTTLVIPDNTVITAINPGVSIVVNNIVAASAAGTIRFRNFNATQSAVCRCRISNLSTVNAVSLHFNVATNGSVALVPTIDSNIVATAANGLLTPAFTASTLACSASTALAAGDGIRIQPSTTLEINISLGTRLWLVASAAATPVQVVAIQNIG